MEEEEVKEASVVDDGRVAWLLYDADVDVDVDILQQQKNAVAKVF